MRECTFRKRQCNAGHFTRPYRMDEKLPSVCPICGQPYDRRFNKTIQCYEDGSTPEELASSEPEIPEAVISEAVISKPVMQGQGSPEPVRRGRQVSQQMMNQPVQTPVQRRTEGVKNRTPEYESVPRRSYGRSLILFTGGERIEIPSGGDCLGREGLGSMCFNMNLLVSKQHAYVKIDNSGKLQVRDADSLNGTYVDDGEGRRKLKTGETALLQAGNTLWLANQVIAIEEE